MIASDMLPPASSLMYPTPTSATKTAVHSYYHYNCRLIMDNALYYLLSRSTTKTSLPRFPPLPLYCSNTYCTPLSERDFRAPTLPRRVTDELRAKTYRKCKKYDDMLNIYRSRVFYFSRGAKKIKKGILTGRKK